MTRKKAAKEKWPREILLLALRLSHGHVLCNARQTERIKLDVLSERGTTLSLSMITDRIGPHEV